MILLLSRKSNKTINNIIDWLFYFGNSFIRIDMPLYIRTLEVNIGEVKNDIKIILNSSSGKDIDLSKIKSVFYFGANFLYPFYLENKLKYIESYIDKEYKVIDDFIFYLLEKRSIGLHSKEINNNKLINLLLAKECGLDIPETVILKKINL